MQESSWDDFRIAYQVAESGSLSKAGRELQINHATVLRHVNRLEETLGVKLFIRHQRGYQLTDAGELLVQELPEIHKRFIRLENMMSSAEKNISGNLRITTVSDFSSLLNPALKAFRHMYPELRIQIIATDEVLPLESGVAHVAIRVGTEPKEADLIVKKLSAPGVYYYASQEYVQQYGLPVGPEEYKQHLWALPSGYKRRIPFVQQVAEHIREEQIIYQSNHFPDIHSAVAEGMAIGPISSHQAENWPDLVKLDIEIDQNNEGLWFVYHKDLRHSARIRALYEFLTET